MNFFHWREAKLLFATKDLSTYHIFQTETSLLNSLTHFPFLAWNHFSSKLFDKHVIKIVHILMPNGRKPFREFLANFFINIISNVLHLPVLISNSFT